MERLQGSTLRARLARQRLSKGEVLRLAIQVADGLSAAHENGIVHRDLKPENIFVTDRGDAKILDFGLAKILDAGAGDAFATTGEALTTPGSAMGTVAYMSPEQALGEPLDARTDVFSFGSVLYEMATGTRPFTGHTPISVINQVINADPLPPEGSDPTSDTGLSAVIRRCLAKDRALRYPSAREVLADLEALRSAAGPGATAAPTGPAVLPVGGGHRSPRSRTRWAAAILAAVVIAAGALWLRNEGTPSRADDVEAEASTAEAIDRSIAVLPFANLSTDEENAFFAAGVHEDVIGRLAGVGDLKVISRNTVRRFANDDRGLQEIARRMGVRYVVEGSVQRSGDEIRVTAQLADSSTDETLWSESYVRQLVDVFALQSAIAEEIANTLRARITPAERRHLEAVPTVVVAAYDEFLKARPLLSSLWLSLGPIEQAIGHLDRALEADPSFAAGWALMARAQSARHAKLLEVDREEDAGQARAAAIAALERARSLDPDAAATYRAEGFFRNAVEGDKIGALRSLDQAVTIVPDDADTLFLQAWIYTELGQVNEAITVMQRAFAVDPANGLIAHGLSYALDMAGRHAELGDFYEQRLNLAPERTHFEVEAKYYRFLADGSLAAYRAFETASRTVERTEQCDLRSIKDAEMVVAMVNEEFGPYREAWKGKWEEHHAGHGDWSCPGQINDELNHAALEIEFGDPQRAQAILAQARESTPRPYSSAVCIFDRATFLPKLHFLSGDPEQARREVVEVIPKVLLNDTFPRGAVERGVLLETVDLVAPDLVYSVYRQIREKGVSAITFEGICANPWTFPNLLKDPRFIAEIREDGRFVEFLEHFELIPRVDDPA